jgi:hypothetical protein
MAGSEKKTSKSPNMKGGSKGGTRFPRLNLKEALGYSRKLVSKTFSGPQPAVTILVGVFNTRGPSGQVRASAVKQYGLMDGDSKNYSASDLAKKIEAVVPEERAELIRRAFLIPKPFKLMYETLQSDKVTRAKVRQAAATCGVHPESLEVCVDNFIEGAAYAGFGVKTDDGIDLSQSMLAPPPLPDNAGAEAGEEIDEEIDSTGETITPLPGLTVAEKPKDCEESSIGKVGQTHGAKPVINLSLTVDPTSDPEKLEKQLKLLRQFGVI